MFLLLLLCCIWIILVESLERQFRKVPQSPYIIQEAPTYEPNPDIELECQVRLLAYEFALEIQPYRGTQPLTFQELLIDQYCDNTTNPQYYKYKNQIASEAIVKSSSKRDFLINNNSNIFTIYIDPSNGSDSNSGTILSPFKSLQRGLQSTRSIQSNLICKQIIIRSGTLYLNETIYLSPHTYDNNLLLTSYPNEQVWISGGILLNNNQLKWTKYNDNNSSHNIWMTKLSPSLVNKLYNNTIYSLFTEYPHQRLTHARYPNGNVEIFLDKNMYLQPEVTEIWWLATGNPPKQIFKNLSCEITTPCLNYSNMWQYHLYTAGYDGVCDLWATSNFWCGQYVAGGWAFEDQHMWTYGVRQIPTGMTYNKSILGNRISNWKSNISQAGQLWIRHQQSWYMSMFNIGEYDYKSGNISYTKGGWQGGNVQPLANSNEINNQPIKTGPYFFSGIFDELDAINEWYFDKDEMILYYYPNTSLGQPPNINLVIGNLSTLFYFGGNSGGNNPLFNVTISSISFRDTRYTYMERWGVPSGGGWSLYQGGALLFENTTNCTIEYSLFDRLDGNAVMLSGYNRNTSLFRNEFFMIADNVMGAWGHTDNWDGTSALQPRKSYVQENYVHQIGLYQHQSSPWFQAKSCQNVITKNIFFNVPRAAINFNDGFGGGNDASSNLLFNTCTESGDHGPINSWDRMPFLTKVANGKPSYDTAMSNVHHNFIIANYGASQGFDTDDGSAWYNIYNNFNWDALGYKNDYGGYNVNYFNNINVCWGKGGGVSCWNIAPTHYEGPSNHLFGNKCIVYGNQQVSHIGYPTSAKGSALQLYNNSYFTEQGDALIGMENSSYFGNLYNVSQLQTEFEWEIGSVSEYIPTNYQIIKWARETLNM